MYFVGVMEEARIARGSLTGLNFEEHGEVCVVEDCYMRDLGPAAHEYLSLGTA